MSKNKLGFIKKVNITEEFPREDKNFTVWLRDNIDILAEKLNLNIIETENEVSAGRYYCDIVAREENTQQIILIENQYGGTNHDHLGKLLTYMAAREAKIVIWIAEDFTDEHISVLEWLNENLDPSLDISFFGIKISLIKIEDSPNAPLFEVVVHPNDWQRKIKLINKPQSDRNRRYFDFFSELSDKYKEKNPNWNKIKPQPQNWMQFSSGKSYIVYSWGFTQGSYAVYLYIDKQDREQNQIILDEMMKYKKEIQKTFAEVKFNCQKSHRYKAIEVFNSIEKNVLELTDEEWNSLIDWSIETMDKFRNLIGPLLDKIMN